MDLKTAFERISRPGQEQSRTIIIAIVGGVFILFVSTILVFFYGTGVGSLSNGLAGLLISAACFSVGILLGFLFGIPRSLQTDVTTASIQRASDHARQPEIPRVQYGANTNLEQISDWLTKILVGVGLTQLISLPNRLHAAGTFLAPALGGKEGATGIAIVIIIFFSVSGFLFGYLWTRPSLGSEFARADLSALSEQLTELSEAQRQDKNDVEALNLAIRYLSSQDVSNIDLTQLNGLIANASPTIRSHIFWRASDLRATHWQSAADKPLLERTIPIFEALINTDKKNRFHRNHGQLGYVLRDKRTPNYAAAEAELTRAIEIRGKEPTDGGELYEFVRAICRINQGSEYLNGNPSTPASRRRILADLKVAVELVGDLRNNADIISWLRLNEITDLRAVEVDR